MMNQVQLIGRLAREVTLTVTENHNKVFKNVLAISRYGANQETDFIPITAWNVTASLFEQYLHKGDEVGIVGSLRSHSYLNKNQQKVSYTDVLVQEVFFLRKKQADKQSVQEVNVEITKA